MILVVLMKLHNMFYRRCYSSMPITETAAWKVDKMMISESFVWGCDDVILYIKPPPESSVSNAETEVPGWRLVEERDQPHKNKYEKEPLVEYSRIKSDYYSDTCQIQDEQRHFSIRALSQTYRTSSGALSLFLFLTFFVSILCCC